MRTVTDVTLASLKETPLVESMEAESTAYYVYEECLGHGSSSPLAPAWGSLVL